SSLTRSGTVVIVTVRVTGVYGACAALGKLPPLHATPATSVQAVAPIAVRRERCRDDMGGCPGLTLVTLRGARSAWRDLRQRCKRIKKGSSGISGKRRMDRGGIDRQSARLTKTRTKPDTTGTARITSKDVVLSCRVRRVRAVSAPSRAYHSPRPGPASRSKGRNLLCTLPRVSR